MAPILNSSPSVSASPASPASPASSPSGLALPASSPSAVASDVSLPEALSQLEIAFGAGFTPGHLLLGICLFGFLVALFICGVHSHWVWVANKYPPIQPLDSGTSAEGYARYRAQLRESRPSWGARIWRKLRKLLRKDESAEVIRLPEIHVGALAVTMPAQIRRIEAQVIGLEQRIAALESPAGGG